MDTCDYFTRSVVTPKLLEKHIQQYVVDYLLLDGWRAFRTELTVQRDRGRVVGERGQPDYLFLRYRLGKGHNLFLPFPFDQGQAAEVLWIEFKAPGEKPRKDQTIWHEAERDSGALVWVVDSIDGWPERYRASGLQRKAISKGRANAQERS